MGARENLARALATEFEIRSAVAAIRAAITSGPRSPNIWSFYSNKNNALLTLIGDVTFIQAILLEGDLSVSSYVVVQEVTSEDPDYKYGRDLVVEFADGSRHWYFCGRYENLTKSPSGALGRRTTRAKKIAEDMGAEFQLRTERDLAPRMTEFWNWLTLSCIITRARDFSIEAETHALYGHLDAHKRTSVRSVLALPGTDSALLLAAMAKALAIGQISADLVKKPLSIASEIWIGKSPSSRSAHSPQPIRVPEPSSREQPIPRSRRTAAVPALWRDLSKWPTVDPNLTGRPD